MSRSLVAMQPALLPWAGYFNLIAQADDFVFLDDVQLEKQSWQTRNRLLVGNRVNWIVLPVRHYSSTQTIAATTLMDHRRWADKLARGFKLNYGRHLHYVDALEIIEEAQKPEVNNLAEFNEAIIRFISSRLEFTPRMCKASSLQLAGARSDRLIDLCNKLEATEYLSPRGALTYLSDDQFVEKSPAVLRVQEYIPGPYPQQGSIEFVSHLSILDVVANLGWKSTRNYVLNGVPHA